MWLQFQGSGRIRADNEKNPAVLPNGSNAAYYDDFYVQVSQVPEPGVATLLGVGLAGLIAFRRTRK